MESLSSEEITSTLVDPRRFRVRGTFVDVDPTFAAVGSPLLLSALPKPGALLRGGWRGKLKSLALRDVGLGFRV